MPENPLRVFETLDSDALRRHHEHQEIAFAAGVLPRKTKLLIAMAMDAALGSANGVRSLAEQALSAGATREEIAEVARVVHYVGGAYSFYNGLGRGLDGVL